MRTQAAAGTADSREEIPIWLREGKDEHEINLFRIVAAISTRTSLRQLRLVSNTQGSAGTIVQQADGTASLERRWYGAAARRGERHYGLEY